MYSLGPIIAFIKCQYDWSSRFRGFIQSEHNVADCHLSSHAASIANKCMTGHEQHYTSCSLIPKCLLNNATGR